MNREYLNSFSDEQLENYLNTLKRRVKDLKQLTLELGAENQELAKTYDETVKKRTEVFHKNEKKKKSWGNWLNKSVEKIGNILHITNSKDPQHNSERDPNHNLRHPTHQQYPTYQRQQTSPHPSNPNEPKYQYKNVPYQGAPTYQQQPQHPQYHYQGSNYPRDLPQGHSSISPKKIGMDLFNKGKQRINKIFNSNGERQNDYEVRYEREGNHHSTLYGEIGHDIEKMRQKNQQKRFQSFLQRTQQPELHQQQYRQYDPNQRPYEQRQERQIWNSGPNSAGGRAQNMQREIERTSVQNYGEGQNVERKMRKEEEPKVQQAVLPKQQNKKLQQAPKQVNSKPKQQQIEEMKHNEPQRILSSSDQEKQVTQPQPKQQLKNDQNIDKDESSEENEYAIHYEAPTLEENTVNQIVEKQIESQEDMQQPSAPFEEDKQQPTEQKKKEKNEKKQQQADENEEQPQEI